MCVCVCVCVIVWCAYVCLFLECVSMLIVNREARTEKDKGNLILLCLLCNIFIMPYKGFKLNDAVASVTVWHRRQPFIFTSYQSVTTQATYVTVVLAIVTRPSNRQQARTTHSLIYIYIYMEGK